ncbi:MAG: hypothetical protein JW969_05525 [Spirochaetales bacterium]|nr:hypothetical protein [Spirochaetales bacterium]
MRKLLPLIAMLLVFLCGFVRADSLSREEINDLFSQGKALFREANGLLEKNPASAKDYYHKAALYFERIVKEGQIRNGKIFYDIANAYFRMGDVGRAILNYKRASQYMPNDLNLLQNFEYARSRRVDKIALKEEAMILRILFFWHYDIPTEIKFYIFILFFALIWICAGILLFFKLPFVKIGLIVCIVFSGVFLSSLTVDFISDSMRNQGVIITGEVIARKGDSDAYSPSFQDPLHAGTEFQLIEKRDAWWNVELMDGIQCWIPSRDAELVKID